MKHLMLLTAALMLAACAPEAKEAAAAPVAEPVAAAPPAEKDPLLSAVGIGVSDLKKSADFYINVMGMQQVRTYELDYMNEVLLRYPDGESYLVLMHWIDGSPRNYKDNPIKLVTRTADPKALQEKIRAAGLEITREYGPSEQVGGSMVGLAKDPDGYVLELLPPRAPTPVAAGLTNVAPPAALLAAPAQGTKDGGGKTDGGSHSGGKEGDGAGNSKSQGGEIGNGKTKPQ